MGSPPNHKSVMRSLAQSQDMLANTCEEFKSMKKRGKNDSALSESIAPEIYSEEA